MSETRIIVKGDAVKILGIIDKGLSSGLGTPKPGQMCIEAAVCYGLGLPHSDKPFCVHPVIRSFKIALNDKEWSSKKARAKGLRRIGIAQLGSTEIDGKAWMAFVAEQHIRRIVPIPLKIAASLIPNHKDALLAAAERCEKEGSEKSARAAYSAADSAAYRAAAVAADSAAYSAAYSAAAAVAADSAAYSAADSAAYSAAYSAADSAAAAVAADSAAYSAAKERDRILTISAEIAVKGCIKFGTQGAEWLDICEVSA